MVVLGVVWVHGCICIVIVYLHCYSVFALLWFILYGLIGIGMVNWCISIGMVNGVWCIRYAFRGAMLLAVMISYALTSLVYVVWCMSVRYMGEWCVVCGVWVCGASGTCLAVRR